MTLKRRVEWFWLLQYHCNYRCPYCVYDAVWPDVLKMDRQHPPERWLQAWRRAHDKWGEGRITMTGGEPTAFPGFAAMMEELTKLFTVSFDTNLSLPLEQVRRLAKTLDPRRTDWLTSYHPTQTALEDYLAKAEALRDAGHQYVCRLVAWPPQLGALPRLRAAFAERGLTFVVNPFQGEWEGKRYPDAYTPEERALILGTTAAMKDDPALGGHAAIAEHNIDIHRQPPTGRLCHSGSLHAYIAADGSVWRCFQYRERSWESFGSFFDEGLALNDGPVICRSPVCEWEYRWLVGEEERFHNADAAAA